MYAEHAPRVYRFLLRMSADASLAEELTQETFFRAIQKIDDFLGTCSINTWLCQIAKHLYFDHKRKHGRIQAMGRHAEGTTADIAQSLLDSEQAKRLHAAIHDLAEPYKEVFSLRIFAELGYGEISALFGKSEGWARVTYYRAKRMLQEKMEEEA